MTLIMFSCRMLAMISAAVTAAYLARIIFAYVQLPAGTKGRVRAILLGLAGEAYILVGACQLVEATWYQLPWRWYASPLVMTGSILGICGLYRFFDNGKSQAFG